MKNIYNTTTVTVHTKSTFTRIVCRGCLIDTVRRKCLRLVCRTDLNHAQKKYEICDRRLQKFGTYNNSWSGGQENTRGTHYLKKAEKAPARAQKQNRDRNDKKKGNIKIKSKYQKKYYIF